MLEFVQNNPILCLCIAYFVIFSLISIIITIYDKKIAGTGKRRVPEATLLMWSALGGSVAMFITMLTIRHKTQHKKFMIGIPAIMILQAALIVALIVLF